MFEFNPDMVEEDGDDDDDDEAVVISRTNQEVIVLSLWQQPIRFFQQVTCKQSFNSTLHVWSHDWFSVIWLGIIYNELEGNTLLLCNQTIWLCVKTHATLLMIALFLIYRMKMVLF